eukprot:4471781-Pyramimonas_sp.AAC.1
MCIRDRLEKIRAFGQPVSQHARDERPLGRVNKYWNVFPKHPDSPGGALLGALFSRTSCTVDQTEYH